MQQRDDSEELSADMRGKLRSLARELQPVESLEDDIARNLRSRHLLGAEYVRNRAATRRRRIAISRPAAAAAAIALFAFGILVGAAGGRGLAPRTESQPSAADVVAGVAVMPPMGTGELVLASDKKKDVVRAIKF